MSHDRPFGRLFFMNKLKLIIDDIPPSNNRFLGQKGKNWEYSRIKKQWAVLIKQSLFKYPAEPFEKSIVRIHYIFPDKRRRDPDNYSGKMILDPLVTYGIIKDDTFNNIKLELSAEVKPKIKKTIIEVISEES